MVGTAFNDVAGPWFWAFVALAVALLSLLAGRSRASLALALLNLGFCLMLVGWSTALVLLLALMAVHGVCRLSSPMGRNAGMAAVALCLLMTFLVHKLQAGEPRVLGSMRAILAAIGMSYIFLRCIEYLRGSVEGLTQDLALVDTINYLIPFHMLAAGPVLSFADFKRQRSPRASLSPSEALEAFERIARGLFKKFVLANGLIGTVFLTDFKADGAYFWLEVQMYYLYIYLDFSAYTDIAVGIGRLLGVATPENFNRPLTARNIVVFWERWHMSLSQFIRRNLFIPIQLAGMRRTNGQHAILVSSVAFGASFLLCGLWHGISWRFLLWGSGHALALIFCNLYREWLVTLLGRKGAAAFSKRPVVRCVATVLTFEFVALSLAFLAHPAMAFLD